MRIRPIKLKHRLFCVITVIICIVVLNRKPNYGVKIDNFKILEPQNEKASIPWWDDKYLQQCSEFIHSDKNVTDIDWYEGPFEPPTGGHCGARSHSRGPNQKVISYVLFGDNPGYWRGLSKNLLQVAKMYPGFVVRLHTDPRGKQKIICPLLLNHNSILDICDMLNLPSPYGNFSYIGDKRLWRLSPYGDPQVDRILVRDTDNKFLQREVDAVKDWIASGKCFHIMRDHPDHRPIVLAGLYGIFQPNMTLRKFFLDGRKIIFKLPNEGNDQFKLKAFFKIKWVTEHSMQHDSYNCKSFPGSIPFPTQRQGNFFLGYQKYNEKGTKISPCPEACRPKNHLDWIRC